MSAKVKQAQAEEALRKFALEVTVLVNPREDPRNIGSGVLLHRDDGTLFVLTAAHLVEDGNWKPLLIGVSTSPAKNIRDAVIAVHLAPDRGPNDPIDVAVLALSQEAQHQLRTVGAPTSCVAPDDDLTDGDFVFMNGYPSNRMLQTGNVRVDADGTTVAGLTVVNLFFVTKTHGRDDKGRLLVSWGDGVADNDGPPPPHIQWKDGERVDMGSPVGVSGAGLWRSRLPGATDLWSPRKHAELVGINSAWNKRDREIVEGVSLWRAWFDDLVQRL